jgi:hypothetical protein
MPAPSGQTPARPLERQGQATYVFCIVHSRAAPSLRGVPDGIPGAGPPRLLSIDGDVWAVVADAPLDRFSEQELQKSLQGLEVVSRHALAHASVVEFFFRGSPVIPLKLFTLFSSDDRVRQDLQSRRATLRRLFAGLRGLEEWGVRIIAGEPHAQPARLGPVAGTGRDYLQSKKRLFDRQANRPRSLTREIQAAMKTLGKLSAKSRKENIPPPGPGRPFVTAASFLVRMRRRRVWQRQIRKLTSELAKRGHALEVSGPWPPYHFVSR